MTITANGLIHFADQLALMTQLSICYIVIGTGTPTATGLGAELKVRGATKSRSGSTVTYSAHWDIDDKFTANITEAGLFYYDPETGKVMVMSGTGSANKSSVKDSLNIIFTLALT